LKGAGALGSEAIGSQKAPKYQSCAFLRKENSARPSAPAKIQPVYQKFTTIFFWNHKFHFG
jgi:hypothetical protein